MQQFSKIASINAQLCELVVKGEWLRMIDNNRWLMIRPRIFESWYSFSAWSARVSAISYHILPFSRILFSTEKMRGEDAEERALSLRKNKKDSKPSINRVWVYIRTMLRGNRKRRAYLSRNTRFETYPTSVHIKHFLSERISSPTLPIE